VVAGVVVATAWWQRAAWWRRGEPRAGGGAADARAEWGGFFENFFAECRFSTRQSLCRVTDKKTLGKETFADSVYAECRLQSVTLSKGFAEC
jgi:hypothetical protein